MKVRNEIETLKMSGCSHPFYSIDAMEACLNTTYFLTTTLHYRSHEHPHPIQTDRPSGDWYFLSQSPRSGGAECGGTGAGGESR
jgi:hypothetical protein